MNLKRKKLLALPLAAALAFGLTACGGTAETAPAAQPAQTETEIKSGGDTAENNGGTPASVAAAAAGVTNAAGNGINRAVRSATESMGDADTWTIFVYLCGADLESQGFAATLDLLEMIESGNGEHLNYVVQTGGASAWYEDVADASELQRFVVRDEDMFLVDSQSIASMGESATLADFLSWGVENYPADKMGLILWDHGSGAINGVCFDENAYDDSLLLNELDAALYTVYDQMTDKFEFIGFDACLMSSVEAAAKLATHANYMIASEETEPGSGWNYTKIGRFLEENPSADGAALGQVICDAFYADCAEIEQESDCTLAVTDLNRIDDVILAFRDYAEDVYNAVAESGDLSGFVREVYGADNYGGNNRSEGYTNMVDLGGVIEAGAALSDNAGAALDALSDAVVYQIKGKDHARASGLSTYFPLEIQGSEELSIFKDVAISPYYLGLVDIIAYGFANAGDISAYDNEAVIEGYDNDYSSDGYTSDGGVYIYETTESDVMADVSGASATGNSGAITFDVEPMLDEDGVYGFVLDENGLMNAASVQAQVYKLSDDGEDLINIGLTSDVSADWENGIFTDNFDGYWFALPSGDLLCVTLVEECDGYDIFTAPVLLNDELTNLRIVWDYETGEAYIVDVWDGIGENGVAARSGTALQEGDVIVALSDAVSLEGDDEFWYYGSEYVYEGDDTVEFWFLPDGEYLYAFCIDDIYGDYLVTEFVNFTVEGENIYF